MKIESSQNILLGVVVLVPLLSSHSVWSFAPAVTSRSSATTQRVQRPKLFLSEIPFDEESPAISPASEERLEQIKEGLVSCCTRATKPSADEVQRIVQELEEMAEQVGIGQASSISGLMNGEWCVFFMLAFR